MAFEVPLASSIALQVMPPCLPLHVFSHVSLQLNDQGATVDLLCDVKMGSKIKWDDKNFHIKAGGGWWGSKKLYKHNDYKDAEDENKIIKVIRV